LVEAAGIEPASEVSLGLNPYRLSLWFTSRREPVTGTRTLYQVGFSLGYKPPTGAYTQSLLRSRPLSTAGR